MHDIWNPWHGCRKHSEGCRNCYMFYLDKLHSSPRPSTLVYKTSSMNYPLSKFRNGKYKIQSGEQIRLCMNSDFFIEEADPWREEVWDIMRLRSDVKFFILTKRAQRIAQCLPYDWGDGYDNVSINVTCENQKRADERMPILQNIPAKHKGVMTAPMLSEIHIEKWLEKGFIDEVVCGGENYNGARECCYEWVKSLSEQCAQYNTKFTFIETGTYFVKDGKKYKIPSKFKQSQLAHKSGLSHGGREFPYKLVDSWNMEIPRAELYTPSFIERCENCGSKPICNGCAKCGKCGDI